ncbi:MAG: hypothetical protein FWC40_00880 [Proteobacteria bacterium]|nr:hypothetical protein [Pseudomonadota bacterium]
MNSTQEALIEYIVQDIILFLTQDNAIEIDAAMMMFYNSQTYLKLYDIETGLYLEGSAYVYEFLKEELNVQDNAVC